MVDTQHFCLRWNNYQSSITSAFENLRDDEDFVDVTLACEGKSLKAHRVVLSACSPYFRELLKSTPCKHPVIVLQDVAFADLHALVEFIYHGEVNVHQRSLTSFLKTAEVLRVSGLTQQAEDRDELPPTITRNHQGFSEKLDDVFPSPITASAVGLRRPGIRRDSEAAGLGSGEFDLSTLSKRSKSSGGADDGHNSVVAAAASMLQQAAAAAAAAANQSTPEDFSPKSRRNNEISENNHHPHTDNDRNERSPNRGEDVKSEPLESCPNIEVDTEDSVEGREPSSVASGQDETDNSAQGPPPGHFHHSNVQEKLQSLFSGSSPSQPAFNFNLPVSRLSEAASLSGLANAAGLNQVGPDLGVGSQGGGSSSGLQVCEEITGDSETFPEPPTPPMPPTPPPVPPIDVPILAPPPSQAAIPLTPTSTVSWASGANKFNCEVCGKVLGTKLTLKRHKEQQHLQPLHSAVCPVCFKVFRTLNSLNNHRSIYHRRQRTEPPPSNRASL